MVAAQLAPVQKAAAGIPDWLKTAARSQVPAYPDDTDAVVLWDEQETTVNGKGEIKTRHRRAYKILRPAGRKYGTVSVDFKEETRLTYLKGWSITATGQEYEIKEKEAIETSPFGASLYEDTRYKVLSIPAADPGSVIGYEFEQKHRPYILQDMWWFQEKLPLHRGRYVLELPSSWEYRAYWLNHPEQEPLAAGRNQWVWEVKDIPAVDPEPSMPAWQAVAGRLAVAFFPERGDRAGKSHDSWNDVGSWYAGLIAGRSRPSPEIRREVEQLTSEAPTTLDKIKALAAFAQKSVRYVAIEIGVGGYQPHAAPEIFTNRYGDCKDKVTLFRAMLREIGVESYFVLVHTERGVVAPQFPSGLSFNHAIAAIRVPEDIPGVNLYSTLQHERWGRLLFFDPTNSLTPFGNLPSFLQGSYGLLVSDDGGELVRMPLLPANINRLLRVGKFRLDAEGTLGGTVQEIRWGAPAAWLRASLQDTPEADRQKFLEHFLSRFVGSLVFRGSHVENLDKIEDSLVVQYGFLSRNYAKPVGDLMLAQPCVLGQKSSDLLEKEEREFPVEFPARLLESDIFEITLPPGYELDELPPRVEVDSGFAEYQTEFNMENNVLKYTRNYSVREVLVPTERLDELKDFYRKIAADERASAVLKRAAP